MQGELPEVRIALPQDEEEIMGMCRRLHDENGIFKLDENKVRGLIHRCFKGEGTIVGVIGPSGRIEASTCLAIGDFYYTGDWHLEEFWNYVQPEYRRSKNADALIEFGKTCADKMGVPLFTGPITSKQMAGKVRLYKRRLGPPLGAYFLYGSSISVAPTEAPVEHNSELRKRIAEFLSAYSDRSISRRVAKERLAPMLKEAATLLKRSGDDDFWSTELHSNGAMRE